MSFISKLFKRKPGGTVIGNLIRGVANTASGGVLGNGQMMITQQDADKRDLSDADYQAKYGQTKDGAIVPGAIPVVDQNTNTNNPGNTATPSTSKLKAFFKKPLVRLIVAITIVGGLVLLIVKLVRKNKRGRY